MIFCGVKKDPKIRSNGSGRGDLFSRRGPYTRRSHAGPVSHRLQAPNGA